MTSEQIRIDAQLLTGLQINTVTARTWVFDAVKYLCREFPLSCPKKTVTQTIAEKNGTYQIEEELSRLEKVSNEDGNRPLVGENYECDERGLVKFYKPGKYKIEYRYVPSLSNVTESSELPIPERFAEVIKYYVSARIRGRIFGQADGDAQNFDVLFQNYALDANKTLQQTNKRHRRMPPRY